MKKKWQNVLGCQRVRHSITTDLAVILISTEKFETRDLRWAPDGKGFILLDKDQFCCGFEVQEEEKEKEDRKAAESAVPSS